MDKSKKILSKVFGKNRATQKEIKINKFSIVKNTYHFLLEEVETNKKTKKLQKKFNKIVKKSNKNFDNENINLFFEKISKEIEDDDYLITNKIENTYNYDNLISNDIKYRIFMIEEEYYIILQVHLGNDIRFNYSRPLIFKIDIDSFMMNLKDIYIRTSKGLFYTDDAGYSFHCNDINVSFTYNELYKLGITETFNC